MALLGAMTLGALACGTSSAKAQGIFINRGGFSLSIGNPYGFYGGYGPGFGYGYPGYGYPGYGSFYGPRFSPYGYGYRPLLRRLLRGTFLRLPEL
jgi:hypothetical protein